MIGSVFFLGITGCFFPRIPRINVTVKMNDTGELMRVLSLKLLVDGIQEFYEAHGYLPKRLADVGKFYDSKRKGQPRWKDLMKDKWGVPYQYERLDAVTYRLTSLGKDRRPGGSGDAEDFVQEFSVYRE